MATVKKFSAAVLLAISFMLFLYVQRAEAQEYYGQSSSYAVSTDEGYIFYQTIFFPFVIDAIRYEVEIEQADNGGFIPVEFIITETNSVEVSLKAGLYRYRYTAINRMNVIEGRSQWEEFSILAGVVPNPQSYQPYYGLYFDTADPYGILVINGSDIFQDSEFALVRRNSGVNWTSVNIQERSDVIRPNRVIVENETASLRFTRGSLISGNYSILIRNPGGLWTAFGEVHVGYKSFSDLTFSFSYAPLIAGFDTGRTRIKIDNDPITNSPVYINQYDHFNPAGYNFRLGWMPFKTEIGNFGFEVQINYLYDNAVQYHYEKGNHSLNLYNLFILPYNNFSLNLLYQTRIDTRWQHNIRLGFGTGVHYSRYWENENDLFGRYIDPFYINLGYSAQFFAWKNLYLEAGLELLYAISSDSLFSLNHLMFRPSIGVGWQFGRWAEYQDVTEGRSRGLDFSVPVTHPPKSEHILSVNWHPMVLLSGFETHAADAYGIPVDILRPFNPVGFSLRYAYIPYSMGENKLGFRIELGILEHAYRTDILNLLSQASVGIFYQRMLSDNWHLNLYAGPGISNNYNYNYNHSNGNFNSSVAFAVNLGASVQFFMADNIFAEAAVDISFIFDNNNTKIAMRPGFAIGYQFNRNSETGLNFSLPNEYADPFLGLPDLDPNTGEPVSDETAEVIPQEPEERPAGLRLLREDNSDRFNSLAFSAGTSFTDPLLIGTMNMTFAFTSFIYGEIGFDIGFFSVQSDVNDYFSIYPFLNIGVFLPFQGKGGFFAGAGGGFMVGSYKFDYGSASVTVLAANFFAGFNIGNVFNISYTLRTNFNSVSHKFSLGYVIRIE